MTKQKTTKLVSILLFLFNFFSSATAHEFWIDPLSATGPVTKKLAAHIRVGQNFSGEAFYYIPGDIKKANITDAKGTYKLERQTGDFPVFDQKVRAPGLQVLRYATTPNQLTYDKAETFQYFIKHSGMEWVFAEHKKRGLPDVGFTEKFVRYAKALMTRGGAQGQDKKSDLMFELVALKNPYLMKLDGGSAILPVKVWWKDKPFAGGLLSIFEKSGDKVTQTQIRSNKDGIINVPITAGKKYMFSMVTMTPLDPKMDPKSGAVWKSHWASLTFSTVKPE